METEKNDVAIGIKDFVSGMARKPLRAFPLLLFEKGYGNWLWNGYCKKVIEGHHGKIHMLWKPGEKKDVGRRKTQNRIVQVASKIYEGKRDRCIELSC